jgi:hypothetical protein
MDTPTPNTEMLELVDTAVNAMAHVLGKATINEQHALGCGAYEVAKVDRKIAYKANRILQYLRALREVIE